MGKFFTFDGIDRAGKSTALANAAKQLSAEGIAVEALQGGRIAGCKAVDFFGVYPDEIVYMLLWQAHRLLDSAKVQPALEQGKVVLCDRYILSNLAHNWWTDLDSEFQYRIRELYLKRCTSPDIYFVFSIPYEVFSERDDGDTIMDENLFCEIQRRYKYWGDRLDSANWKLEKRVPRFGAPSVIYVDGTESEEAVCELVVHHIKAALAREDN